MPRQFSLGMVSKSAEPWLYNCLRSLLHAANEHSGAVAAVARGESPDGSGNPLPGGLTVPNDPGAVLFVAPGPLLGTSLATLFWDNTNKYLGVGTNVPTARIHSHLSDPGATTLGTLGTHFAEFSVDVSSVLKNILAVASYANGAGSFDAAFVSGGTNPLNGIGSIYFTDINASTANGTGLRLAYGTIADGTTSKQVHMQVGGLTAAGLSQNNSLVLIGMNDNIGKMMRVDFERVWFGSHAGSGEGGSSVLVRDTAVFFNIDAEGFASTATGGLPSVLIGKRTGSTTCAALVVESSSDTLNTMEVRKNSNGSSPNKSLGDLCWAIGPGLGSLNTERDMIAYQGGTEVVRQQISAASFRQWGFVSSGGVADITFASAFAGHFTDGHNGVRIGLGDSYSGNRTAAFTSGGGNILTRLGIGSHGTTIQNDFLGNLVIPGAVLRVVNSSANGANGTIVQVIQSQRAGQTANLTEWWDSSAAAIAYVDFAGAGFFRNLITDTTGMKIATATSQKLGFWNANPIAQPTTAITAATFVANTSAIADDSATFDGYTIGQVVAALRSAGLLA